MNLKDAVSVVVFPIGIARLFGGLTKSLNYYYEQQEADNFE